MYVNAMKSEINKKLGKRIQYLRQQRGLSQEKLAEESGVSRNTISAIETGTNVNVTREIMEKIAKALGEKVSTIFFD